MGKLIINKPKGEWDKPEKKDNNLNLIYALMLPEEGEDETSPMFAILREEDFIRLGYLRDTFDEPAFVFLENIGFAQTMSSVYSWMG